MKIGIVHNSYLLKGGEDVMVEQEYQLLKRNKVPVEILYFTNEGNKWRQAVRFLLVLFNPYSFNLVSRWIDTVKPDVIHLHNWHYTASPSVIRAAKKKGIPVVHTLHNFRLLCPSGTLLHNNTISSSYLSGSFPWEAVRQRVYRNSYFQTFWLALATWVNKKQGTWKSIDKYIALTEHAKQVFRSADVMSEDQIAVKPNFIADIPAAEEKRGTHFLYTGRLSEEKGIELLLRAFAYSGYPLRIIGDGPLRGVVETYAARYSNIIYLGFKNKEAIIKELRICSALIFSSIWFEGNPLTIIEALACGTAVIAPKLGAMLSMIEDGYNGLHFAVGSEEDLIQKLNDWQQLLPREKETYYTNARRSYIKNYTPAKNFEKLISIYKSVANHGKTKPLEPVY